MHYPTTRFIAHPKVFLVPLSHCERDHNCSQGQDISSAQRFRPIPHMDAPSAYLYSQKRKVIDFHASDFWQKCPRVPRLLQQFRAEIQKELWSASGSDLRLFGPIAVTIATCGSGVSTALTRDLIELRTAPTLDFAHSSRNNSTFQFVITVIFAEPCTATDSCSHSYLSVWIGSTFVARRAGI